MSPEPRIKTILFACGTGVATSTAVNATVTEEMKKRGLTFNAQQAKATEVASLADNVGFIVSTTPISASVTKPVIKGLPFLTGIGKDKTLDEIEPSFVNNLTQLKKRKWTTQFLRVR